MDLLEELGAVRAIQETKARYFRFMDTRDFAAMETLFTADAHVDVSVSGVVLEPGSKEDPYQHPARMEGGVFDDRTAFLTFLQSLLTGVRSVYQGHKYRYMRGIDTYERDLLHACFTADVTLWPSADSYIARGREEVVALMKASISDTYYSSHIVAQPEIELTGRDRATGKWRLEDIVYFTGTNAAITHVKVAPGQVLTGAGVYHDEYHRVDGRWLIASCGYVRIFETVTNRGSATMQVTPDPRRGMAPPPLN